MEDSRQPDHPRPRDLHHNLVMKQLADSRAEFNRLAVEFLLTDADLGLTIVEGAKHRNQPETRAQTINRARRAYDSISKRRGTVEMSAEDSGRLDTKLTLLKQKLTEAEQTGPEKLPQDPFASS